MTAPEVMQAFSALTRIRFRVVAPDVEAQAIEFVKAGFTLRELELVVAWTKREIAAQRGGYSAASLQWRVLFGRRGDGSEFLVFQERLGLAQEALKRGWKPRFASDTAAPRTAAPHATEPAAPVEPGFDADKWAAGQAEREAFRRSLRKHGS